MEAVQFRGRNLHRKKKTWKMVHSCVYYEISYDNRALHNIKGKSCLHEKGNRHMQIYVRQARTGYNFICV